MKVAGRPSTIEIILLAMAAVFLLCAGAEYTRAAQRLSAGEYVITTGRQTAGTVTPDLPADAQEEGAGVDINTADVQLLQTLPGIGPVLAQRIIDYREEHGPFTAVEQLLEVKGIGEATLAELQGGVVLGQAEEQAREQTAGSSDEEAMG